MGPCRKQDSRGRTAPTARMGARERISSAVLSGSNDRLCQPEGRRRQDDDRSQSRDLLWPSPASGSSSSISTPRAMPRAASESIEPASTAPCTTCSSSDRDLDSVDPHDGRRRVRRSPRPRWPSPVPRSSWPRPLSANGASRARSRGVADRVRLRPHRLSAVARPADRQRAHGGRLRPHPDAMRVLRPGRPLPADRDAEPRPRQPEPDARDQGRRAHDVRRADEPVVRRRRGGPRPPRRRRLRHGDPAQRPPVGGAELRPADRAVPRRLARRRGLRRVGSRAAPARQPRTRDAGHSGTTTATDTVATGRPWQRPSPRPTPPRNPPRSEPVHDRSIPSGRAAWAAVSRR